MAADLISIPGGVVAWRGAAILIPAASGAGTATLAAALVRRGAQWGSTGCALLDDAGSVHLLPMAAAPIPAALVVATAYRPGCIWSPRIQRGAPALLPIVDHAVRRGAPPARALRLAAALAARVVTLASPRPDAEAVAPALLAFADAVLAAWPVAPGGRIAPEHGRPGRVPRPGVPVAAPDAAPATTYVVGGMTRSGTSMMTRALGAGGLDIFSDPAKEERAATAWARRGGAYHPNPHGLHEPGAHRSHPRFAEMIRGRLVKLLGSGAAPRHLAGAGPFRVAYIHRDREAVARSHLATFGTLPTWTTSSRIYRQVIDGNIDRQRARAWVRDVTCFAYEDVVRDPLRQFSRLAEIGWPIDPRAAAATVDPGLDRNGTAQGARSAAMIGVCTR